MGDTVQWPAFWPEQPTDNDAATAAASHAREVVEWWTSSNPVGSYEDREAYAAWSPEERHRLVLLADVMWVLGDVNPSLESVVRKVTKAVYGAEYVAGLVHLTQIAQAMTPQARSVALYPRENWGTPIEDGTCSISSCEGP